MSARGTEPPAEPGILDALHRATDQSADAWAVFESVRDTAGTLIDLRIVHANRAYWQHAGMDPADALGRGLSELAPAIDWNVGLAGRLFAALKTGRSVHLREVRFRQQVGPGAGLERVYEVELHVVGELLTARLRDRTDEVEAARRAASDGLRNAALARFLSASVDPAIERSDLLRALAAEVAIQSSGLCVIIDRLDDSTLGVAAAAGGPAGVAEQVRSGPGGIIPMPDATREAFLEGRTYVLPEIPDDVRPGMVDFLRLIGLSDEVGSAVSSVIGVPIRMGERVVGRLQVARFEGDPAYTDADREALEAIAHAAALVLGRQAARDDLVAAASRWEALFEQAPVAMITVDPALKTRHNRAALELFGRDQEEIARFAFKPGAPWIPAEAESAWLEVRRRVAAGETINRAALTVVRPSGERREVEGSSIPYYAADGSPAGILTVMIDLTDRNSLEAQLQHAQKMEALGRLAGGIAHDFNNVLMAILGYAEFIAQDALTGTVDAGDAEQVLAATRRAIELTARLTAFARRDQAVVDIVDATELVRSLLPLLRRLAPESIELVADLQPSPPVLVSSSEFDQVIVNLVVNAVDAMPEGGRLTIETGSIELGPERAATHLGEVPGEHAVISVSDSGMGMDEATRARIFEPFYTTKPVGEGTGLGLSSAFASVQGAGGRLWVYSEPGHGSTFRIYLPRAAGVDGGAPVAAAPDAPPERGSERILLLEDDTLVRDLVTTILEGLGYSVAAADLPSRALELAATQRFELLLTDVVMPEMMGDEVAARLRESDPDLRVIFMSGYTARALSFELGSQDLMIHKPISPGDLGRAVRMALDAP
jgi:two-component system cell cycle sensor histidine kinase/response regulator CckA